MVEETRLRSKIANPSVSPGVDISIKIAAAGPLSRTARQKQALFQAFCELDLKLVVQVS